MIHLERAHGLLVIDLWVAYGAGGPGHTNFASFSAAVIVVGGSGISFGLGIVNDLVEKDLKGRSSLKAIEMIWAVQDPGRSTTQYQAPYLRHHFLII